MEFLGQGNPRNPRSFNNRGNWRSSRGNHNNGPQNERHNNGNQPFNTRAIRSGISNTNNQQFYQRGRANFPNRNNPRRYQSSESHHEGGRDAFSSGQPRERRGFGFRALESLLEKDPEELMLDLSNTKRGVVELTQSKLTEDTIILFIKILKKVIDASFEDVKYKVLQMYLNDKFIETLVAYILYLPMQDAQKQRTNKYFWNNSDEFWYNILGICQFIYDTIPTFGRRIVPNILKSVIVCFPSFELQHNCHISDEIKENAAKLNEAVQLKIKEYEEAQKADAEKKVNHDDEGEPPDDFRQISVYPSSLELIGAVHGFVRRNVVKGAYRDVNHYLDVQFRLLREDFVGPLRTGITSYRQRHEKEGRKRLENVRVHPKVQFLHPETANEHYCIRLRFDTTKKKKDFKYENSKRFMFGSLLCFTADDFRSVIFGKVAKREVTDLQKGELVVGFDQNVTVQYNANYLMVECNVFFEPYYHVLNVLQTMSVDNFPMEKYIIYADPSVEPPQYLRSPNCTYTIRGQQFFPLINWPLRNVYNLNDSQLAAFKAALTQEFSIIQGPPGTGKTFLGLKIAKTLIENHKVWYKKTPMLVICYTNHALDQFLEGVTEFTKDILRVGGQSKNENLQSYNLRNQKRFKLNAAVFQQKSEVRVTLGNIQYVSETLKQVEFYHSVRNFDVFVDVVPNFRTTWFARAKKDDILNWLLGSRQSPSVPAPPKMPESVQQFSDALTNLILGANQEDDSDDSDDEEDDFKEEFQVQVDDLFDDVKAMATQCSLPLITLSSLQNKINELEAALIALRQIEEPTPLQIIKEESLDNELWNVRQRHGYLNFKLVEGKQKSALNKEAPASTDLNNPYNMPLDDRWDLYFYWLDLYKQQLQRKLELLNIKFREEYKIYEEMRDIENTNSMKSVLVVGMTTTGAARLRSSLQALRSPVVIVEEAAEVLEAHIISALTKHCQHLILIGDHQQLKPSTANFQIERFYNLGISLFERMVLNKIQLFTLNVQHRMRPEISSLITPTIYPKLEDHPSVNDRPQIKGVDNCLFFLDHTNPEAQCEGTSKKNYHEVEFLINFAKHLVLNGYRAEQITILAAYLGQMFEMQKERKKYDHVLKGVRIAVLDNYQGEECDIILLSLVRNNEENNIGFLKIENRVCVALSRARNGFYITGNMSQLCSQSELWQKIRRTLDQQNSIGTEIPLRCQIHPDKVTYVKSGVDFLNIPEGGCDQKCGADLVCGHQCKICCHIQDRDHLEYRCRELCNKRLCDANPLHLCKKMCYQNCGPCNYPVQRSLKCGHTVDLPCHEDPEAHACIVPVSTRLPCGHVADKPCHCNAETFRCPHPCEVKVEPCGHACEQLCHVRRDPDHLQYQCKKKCARFRKGCTRDHLCPNLCYEKCDPCTVLVKKARTVCPHWYDVKCSSNVDDIQCEKPCTKKLPCDHKCKSKCYEKCGKCEIKVEKTAPCGHSVKVRCCDEPDQKLCNRKCPRQLPCGHACTKKCNEPCTTHCPEIVKTALATPCGHQITQIICWIASSNIRQDPKTLLKYCNAPCSVELKCEHKCSGTCGECYQGRVHKPCNEKCGFPLVCNHPCEFPCRQACRPCARPCPYKCKHSSCGKRCGDVCTPCKEKCARSCRHQKCTKFCGEVCDVPPCTEPCPKMLTCDHPCIGFCGDPCPPKCLICDEEELTTILLGHEDEEGARFILLNDCGHIIESQGMETWMQQNSEEIAFKLCPLCKTPVKSTHRYSDSIKTALADVAKVKLKFYGSPQEINQKRGELILKLLVMKQRSANSVVHRGSPRLGKLLEVLQGRLQVEKKGKRQPINKSELNAIESKLQVIDHVLNICTKVKVLDALHEVYFPQIELLMKILSRDENNITNQEIDDIQFELNRLSRMVEFSKMKKIPQFTSLLSGTKVKTVVDKIENKLFGVEKFYEETEERVMRYLKELNQLLASGIGISDKERREIVAAIGLKQGHWYKCRNGHPYAIGECGGANQLATCPECKTPIGGTSHTLVAGNAVATEMDGARFAAWSDAANNMGNFQF